MRFFKSLLFGVSLITTLTAAIPFGSDAEVGTRESRELLVLRDNALPSPSLLYRDVALTPAQEELVKEAEKEGTKITEADVVNIWKTTLHIPGVESEIIFLEKGNSRAGLEHIVQAHGKELLGKGITEAEIPQVLQIATTRGKIVGQQGKKKGRPIFETNHDGKEVYLAITIGSNGFVVGMNACGKPAGCSSD